MNRYSLSMQAYQDFSEILAYYGSHSETAARKFELAIVSEFVALGTLPAKYRHDPAVMPLPTRVRPFREFLIYYDADTSPVTILRVVHGSRDLSELLHRRDTDD